LNPFLMPPPFRNIAYQPDQFHLTIVEDARYRQLHREGRAVFTPSFHFLPLAEDAGQYLPECILPAFAFGVIQPRHQDAGRTTHHFTGGIAEDTRGRIIKGFNGTVDVRGDDTVSHIIEDRLGVLRSFAQRGFKLLPFNRDSGRVRGHGDHLLMTLGGSSNLAIIDDKSARHLKASDEEQCRPAQTQPVVEGEVGITVPHPDEGNVDHYAWFGTVGGTAAGTLCLSDGAAANATIVLRRQARGDPMAE